MKTFILIFLALLTTRVHAEEETASTMTRNSLRSFLEQTIDYYSSEDPADAEQAAQNFQTLSLQAPEGEMDPDALALAEGMSLLKAGKAQQALERLEQIEGFEESKERSQTRLMKGNAQRQLAEAAVSSEQWDDAKSQMSAAVESYKNALREDSNLIAARQNLEIANERLKEIIELTPPPPENQNSEDQEDQEDQENQEESEKNQERSQDQEEQTDQQDQQDQEDQADQQDQGEQEDQENSEESSEQEQEEEPSNPAGQGSESGDPAEQLDAKQAQQLLEAALEQEKRQRRQILQQRIQSIPVEKDW
jgi:hypothetical protein